MVFRVVCFCSVRIPRILRIILFEHGFSRSVTESLSICLRGFPWFSVFVFCSVRILRMLRIFLFEHGFSWSVTESLLTCLRGFSVVFRVVCFCSVRISLIFRISYPSASVLSVRSVQFPHLPPCCSVYFRVRFLFCTDSTDLSDILSIGIRVIRPIRTVHPSASVLSVRSVQTHSAPSV